MNEATYTGPRGAAPSRVDGLIAHPSHECIGAGRDRLREGVATDSEPRFARLRPGRSEVAATYDVHDMEDFHG